ncbi:MAG: BlaI/MecI/CopY family transcriptional regulator [Chitinophagaceae bacterium]|nr:MAG: BlaI/MecI/CopY family transcriptional regulator [Chitinophagaceae bacterium]
MQKQFKRLTKAEEEIMQVLWEKEKAFVKEIISFLPEPKPAYNTVSTIVRILETKGFVSHEQFGKSHRYYPLISKDEYAKFSTKKLMQDYFENSAEKMLSFFVKEENLDIKELDEILKKLKQKK